MSSKIYPLGSYKISKVGNSFKISVPPKLLEIWGLKDENDKEDNDSPNVYIYAENRDGKIIMVASLESFDDFHWIETVSS